MQTRALDRLVLAGQQCRRHSSHIQPAGPSIAKLPSPIRFLPGGSIVTRHLVSFAVRLVACFMLAGTANVLAMPSPFEVAHAPIAANAMSGSIRLAQTQPAQAPAPSPAQPAADATTDAQAPGDEPIGNVAAVTGIATVIRNKDSVPLKLKDDIFLNDVLQTSANSSLGVTFNDATTFHLSANSRITVDSYVYEDGGQQNAALFDVAKGTVAFVAAAVAKTGDMKISTPTATMGIRGTIGRIEVNDRAGARIGFLTQGASGFAIRGGGGMRVAAVPLTISPQQALRDQGFVRQVHSAQNVGRQVVTEQRALRRANPALNNPNRTNQPRQPGPQRQNGLPQRPGSPQPGQPNRPGQQPPGVPNRQGLQQRPGSPAQPGAQPRPGLPPQPGVPPRAGQPQQPGVQGQPGPQNRPGVAQPPNLQQPDLQRQTGVRQGAPGLQRPGLQNRPALLRRPGGPPPKGKRPKDIR